MPVLLDIKSKGRGPRSVQTQVNATKRDAWLHTGEYFHGKLRDKRFTAEHAREAGYIRRRGEGMAQGTKAFRASYTGRKLRLYGHTRPLEFTGETRRLVRQASIQVFSMRCQVRYAGARKFNFRNPKSQINMAEEFRRVTTSEIKELGEQFNNRFEERFHTHRKDS